MKIKEDHSLSIELQDDIDIHEGKYFIIKSFKRAANSDRKEIQVILGCREEWFECSNNHDEIEIIIKALRRAQKFAKA